MPARRPAVVAFDVIETLFSLEKLRPRLVALGLPLPALHLWFTRVLRDAFALDAAGTFRPFPEVAAGSLQVLCAMHGAPLDAASAQDVVRTFGELDAHPDVGPAFAALERAGIAIAALSNGSAAGTGKLLERAGLGRRLARVVTVEEIRRWKPGPAIYRHAAAQLGHAPERVALVAVHHWDCQGAQAAGLVTGWASRLEKMLHPAMPPPDVTGQDLVEVAERLAALPT